MSLQAILASSNASDLCEAVQKWDTSLSQIEDLVNLWYTCQNQV